MVKSLTGNDTITARFLHENSFEYRPQFKMFINTNYLPQITDLTLFSSGRIKTIPFERHFEEREQDRSLKETSRTDGHPPVTRLHLMQYANGMAMMPPLRWKIYE